MKKNFKLVLALVLAAMMIASMIPAMAAAGEYTITVTNPADSNISIDGKPFYAHKLFDLVFSGDNYAYTISTSNQFYSSTVPTGLTKSPKDVLDDFFTFGDIASDSTKKTVTVKDAKKGADGKMTAAAARELADALQPYIPATSTLTANGSGNSVTIDVGEPGYFLVTGAGVDGDNKSVVSAVMLDNTDKTASIVLKAEAPELDKKITGEFKLDEAGNAATAEIGKTVSFELDSNVPDFTGYDSYDYIIHDTMSSGLRFGGTVTVTIGGESFTDFALATASSTDAQKTAAGFASGDTFSVKFGSSFMEKSKGAAIVVTYSATVLESALQTNYEKNTAHLEYSNNPYDDSHNHTPDDTVYVIDINMDVLKYAGSNTSSTLAGAEFLLFQGESQPADTALAWYHYNEDDDVVEWVARANADTFTTNDQGHFQTQVRGLKAQATGTKYGLLETVPPTGYNLLTAPIIITLTGAYADASGNTPKQCTITADVGTVTGGTIDLSQTPASQPVDTVPVSNNSGTELPSTGGIGTTIFYIGGSILVLAAAILLITKRRMGNND